MWWQYSILIAALAGLAEPPTAAQPDLRKVERDVFAHVNEVRTKEGLDPLIWSDDLAEEGRRHSRSMVAYWFFDHRDPLRGDLAKRLKSKGIAWRWCAENIYNSVGYADPASRAVHEWLRSPAHRDNLLSNRLTHTGVGASLRADGTIFLTQEFTRP